MRSGIELVLSSNQHGAYHVGITMRMSFLFVLQQIFDKPRSVYDALNQRKKNSNQEEPIVR